MTFPVMWSKLYCWVCCKLGRPVTYRKPYEYPGQYGLYFAMCKHCDRQAEVHEFGGPRPRDAPDSPPEDL